MAIVTGTLTDFGIQPFPELQPRLIFTASGPGVSASKLLATRPIIVTPSGSGAFSVDLHPTASIKPVVYYKVTIEWLDPSGNYVSADFLEWKIFVPGAGGTIPDLIETPANPSLIWVGDTAPPNGQPGQKWLYTGESNGTYIYGKLYELRG